MAPPETRPSEALVRFVADAVGHTSEWSFVGWEHAESRVWRIDAAQGEVYLKAHRQRQKFVQERHAYTAWTPVLGPSCPRLLASHDSLPHALLLTGVPGVVMEGRAWSTDVELAAHEAAGRFLARLHALDFADGDPVPVDEAVAQRFESWRVRATGTLPDDVLDRAQEMLRPQVFTGMRRVPCHRDFSPRNWLWSEDGLRVIDFEHARPDLWLTDVVKLDHGSWVDRPELRTAFWRGYARPPSGLDLERLKALQILYAISTVVWAREHGDETFEAFGHTLVQRAFG